MWLVRRVDPVARQRRDPQAATLSPVRGFWMRRNFKWSANNAIDEALYANVYVYACARARAEDLASLPIRVGADPTKPRDYDTKHPIAKLLGPAPGHAAPGISSRRLLAWSSMQFDVAGRFGWEIASPVNGRRDGVPFELWPLPAGQLTPVNSAGGAQWFQGFDFTVQGNIKRRLTNQQVMYGWRPSQDDFREPESLLKAAALNVSIAVMQDRYDFAFLNNDARPAAVIVHEAFDKKGERNAFRRQFLDTHKGADNAGKVSFVEASADGALPKESLFIQTLGLSQRDAEFIERYENQIRAICVAFATPLSRLADSSRRTYANAERETKNYWRNAVNNQAIEMAEIINTDLVSQVDPNNVLWFDTTGIPELEPPRRFAVGDIPALIAAKVITKNEARAGLELPGVEGGDEWEEDVVTPTTPVSQTEDRVLPQAHSSVVRGMLEECNVRADQLAHSMLQSAQVRQAGKRGRQAQAKGGLVWDLLDQEFWYDRATAEFASWAKSTARAACLALNQPYREERVAEWAQRWGVALADRWMVGWRQALNQPIESFNQWDMTVSIDPLVAQTAWISARSMVADQQIELESVADILVKLYQGEVSPEEALASL